MAINRTCGESPTPPTMKVKKRNFHGKKTVGVVSIFGFLIWTATPAVHAEEAHITPVAPAKYLEMENPIDFEDLEGMAPRRVKRAYKSKCKKCHGMDGDGQGSAAADMVLKPTAFTVPGYMESKSDGQLFWMTRDGSKGTEMKAFGAGSDTNLSDEEIWKLVAYMRHHFTR